MSIESVDFSQSMRLYGQQGFERIASAHVLVIGCGGVGSWAVEALARAGIGQLTIVDGDVVALSNINRQIHALVSTVGQKKVDVLKERIQQINPQAVVHAQALFLKTDIIESFFLNRHYDFVIDAIDDVNTKAKLVDFVKKEQIPFITAGSAGGKTNPCDVCIADITRVEQDPLLAKVKKKLRREYGFTKNLKTKFHIDAVYSLQPINYPKSNDVGFGTAMAVTATFGLTASAYALKQIAGD